MIFVWVFASKMWYSLRANLLDHLLGFICCLFLTDTCNDVDYICVLSFWLIINARDVVFLTQLRSSFSLECLCLKKGIVQLYQPSISDFPHLWLPIFWEEHIPISFFFHNFLHFPTPVLHIYALFVNVSTELYYQQNDLVRLSMPRVLRQQVSIQC